MMDLNGHEAGNGGYSQGKSKGHRVSSTRRSLRVFEPSLMSRAAHAGWYRVTGMRSRHLNRSRRPLPGISPAGLPSWTARLCVPPDGRPLFYKLMRRRGPFCFYAFDLLWLDGSDLQDRPLSERKTLLRKLLPRPSRAVLYVEHVANGTDLFRLICERDMEGVVAKQASARYTPEATTWVKAPASMSFCEWLPAR